MKLFTIKASKRESLGKKATKALRNAEQVPCVVYGGDTVTHFTASEIAFQKLVYTPNVYTAAIELEDGTVINAVMQDIQFHPVTDRILHIDFVEIFEDKPITMEIPVKTVGNSPGVAIGGNLKFNFRRLKVKGLPGALPDVIEGDISGLNIGNKLFIRDLANEGYEFLHPESAIVCQVKNSRNAMAAATATEEE